MEGPGHHLSVRVVLDGSTATVVDVEHWSLSASGPDPSAALESLHSRAHERFAAFHRLHGSDCGPVDDIDVIERHETGVEEWTFASDEAPATEEVRHRTLQLHRWAREDLIAMVVGATEEELDWDDQDRTLPSWAWWRTARGLAWHCAITETRYYLDRLGVAPPPEFASLTTPFPIPHTRRLLDLLSLSAEHVQREVGTIAPDIAVEVNGERWTTRKALRRLAGHEREENDVTQWLLVRARMAGSSV